MIQVYTWYKEGYRVPYPSTLHVTVKGIIPPSEIEPAARSMFPTQREKGQAHLLMLDDEGGEQTLDTSVPMRSG